MHTYTLQKQLGGKFECSLQLFFKFNLALNRMKWYVSALETGNRDFNAAGVSQVHWELSCFKEYLTSICSFNLLLKKLFFLLKRFMNFDFELNTACAQVTMINRKVSKAKLFRWLEASFIKEKEEHFCCLLLNTEKKTRRKKWLLCRFRFYQRSFAWL